MKSQSQQISALPNIASGGIASPATGSCTSPTDVSSAPGQYTIAFQVAGLAASTGQTVAVDASLDGKSWTDVTAGFVGAGGTTAAADPITTDGLYVYRYAMPGMMRVRCVAAGSGIPAVGYLNWVDSRIAQ
jgi:hypothetical protein